MAPITLNPCTWMSRVPGHLSLAALSIPGSHDTACRRGAVKFGLASFGGDFVYTQYAENNLLKQLEMGVRFLDYRIEDGGNLCHGPAALNGNLFDELNIVTQFLWTYCSECVCVSIKWEKERISVWSGGIDVVSEPPSEAARIIDKMVRICGADQLWLESRIPTLDEARGKIVFLTRFNAVTKEGIRYNPGAEDFNDLSNPSYRSQDHYDLTHVLTENAPLIKFNRYVLPFMMRAITEKTNVDVWYFNFTSGYAGKPPGWHYLSPAAIAWGCKLQGQDLEGVNMFLITFLTNQGSVRVGTLLMDFVSPDLVRAVYSTNRFVP